MSLNEAMAVVDKLLAFGWIEDSAGTRVEAAPIRAAIGNVALAVLNMPYESSCHCKGCTEVRAEIAKHFPERKETTGCTGATSKTSEES